MNLTEQITSRFKVLFLSDLILAISSGILTVVLARLLDPSGYGLLFLALTVFGVFSKLARLGIPRSASRYIAEYKKKKRHQVPHIVRAALVFNLITIVITTITLALTHQYIADLLNEPDLAPLLILGVFHISLSSLTTFLLIIFQGFEDIKFVAVLQVIERVIRVILAVGLVLLGLGAVGALWGYILSFVVSVVIGFIYLYKRIEGFRESGSVVESGLRRRIAEYAVPITATHAANTLDGKLDTLLVGFFLSPIAVSFYVIGEQVIKFVETPMGALGFTLSPRFGSQKASGNIEQASRIYESALVNSLLLYIPAGAGIILVADPLIHLLFGPDYSGAIPVLQVLGLYAVLKCVTKLTDNGLDYLGRARVRAIAKGLTAVLNVVLNVILIPLIGVVGAAIATVFTYSLYTSANVFIVSQEFELRIGYILKNVGWILGVTVVMSAVVFVLTGYISGWVTLILIVVVGVIVWAILSVLVGLLDLKQVRSVLL
ncbi:flippase [Natronocalculus amylovorans]|uniref:Flippase n=1 Tax=Natronocalculus amylovorans TaxID=2917812 RepID=A0AAE3G0D4_9EURY|nr:flippase [Natronocalculus amylovorans]MCL9818298.1 flippase [Natronocalculus amylovorans]